VTRNFLKHLVIVLLLLPQVSKAEIVIAHPDVAISTLSSQGLRSIFSMRSSRWPDQMPMRVFVLTDKHPLHRSFVKSNLGMFPYQLRMIWDRSVFSGAGFPPILVATPREMLFRVQSTEGAVGYMDDNSLPLLEGVKIIEIQ
jgi:hypothetical protein